MKVLIIGSKGFIGRHCKEYFEQKHEVWGCDIVLDYNDTRYIVVDAVDADFASVFSRHIFDLCINCSGAASVPFSLERPLNDFGLNVINVVRILEAIRLFCPGCKFVTMSSAAVYGNPEGLPIRKDFAVVPISPYGYHKAMSEYVCEEYYRFWGVKTCCLRVFSAYGPGLKKQLFWDMYKKFKNNRIVELWGTGNESRDFIYISDLVRAVEFVVENADFKASIVNVANGVQVAVRDVSDTFVKVLQSNKSVMFNKEERKGDPIHWRADISDLKEWGYKPMVSLEEGVGRFVKWAEKELQ